ncbi:MAG TPA: class I SAM-dependent methyltransferase [Tepidisphaeraceae bacterium]
MPQTRLEDLSVRKVKGPSEFSRLLLRVRFEARRRLAPAWHRVKRLLNPPVIGSLVEHWRARAEVARALAEGRLGKADTATIAVTIDPRDIPSLVLDSADTADRVLAEIDQDGFAFAIDPADRAYFNTRDQRLPRVRYRLDVVLRDGRVCVRKQFVRQPGVRAGFWGALGRHFYNEAAALLRLRDLPSVPKVRALDRKTHSIYIDYVRGENLKQRIARGGVAVHDLDMAAPDAPSHEEQRKRQIAAFSGTLGSLRPAIKQLVADMAARGVHPMDVKLGNLIVGEKSGTLYWVDFERAYLSRGGRPSAARLEQKHELLNEWFGLGMVTRAEVAEYARTREIYSPVDLEPLGYWGDLADVQAGEGRWRWLLRDLVDWRGKRLLDLGTNNCLYGFREALAGAAEVHCVERDADPLDQARFLKNAFEQLENRRINVNLHHTDILSFLRGHEFAANHFDITTALCSIYYLSREEIAESLRIVARISRECWLQGNVWTPRADPKVAEYSRPEFLAEQLRVAGFSDVTLIWPKNYRRPLLIGRKPTVSVPSPGSPTTAHLVARNA